MKDSDLETVRKKYFRIKKKQEKTKKIKQELLELKKDENVKRYIQLSETLKTRHTNLSEKEIIIQSYQDIHIENQDSNHILVFMGSHEGNDPVTSSITYDGDPNTTYKAYLDLETEEAYNIPIANCEEFEKEHLVLYFPVCDYCYLEYEAGYSKLLRWFRAELMVRSQQDIILELQQSSRVQYDKLYSECHKLSPKQLDTNGNVKIIDMPIDEFVKRHPENGFVEKFCLSDEEKRRVKLYRTKMKK